MKKQKEANKLIIKGLLALNAKKNEKDNTFELETKGGKLTVHPSNDTLYERESKITTLSCFSRFDDPEKANKILRTLCNSYTGKWNWHHWSKQFTAQTFANLVLSDIKSIV